MEKYKKNIEELAIEFELSTEEINDLYSTYLIDIKEYIKKIEALYIEKLWSELFRNIHNIKGMTANLRLDDVFYESSKLCKGLKEGSLPSKREIDKFLKLLEASCEKINALFLNR
jgi:HPt (histidine-containing phosphotransfer) domain-containing protein